MGFMDLKPGEQPTDTSSTRAAVSLIFVGLFVVAVLILMFECSGIVNGFMR